MREMKDLYVLIITTLMTLLIMGMVLIEFETLDTTLVAGIIAFWGAIIGGSITLIGVNKTIKDGRRRDKIKFYNEKLRERAALKYDVTTELSAMKYDLSMLFEDIYSDGFNDQEILDVLNILEVRIEKLIRDGIVIGDNNFSTLNELKSSIGALYEYYNDMNYDNDSPEETHYFEEYPFGHEGKKGIFDTLNNAIDICYSKSKVEHLKLFNEVFEYTGSNKKY